MSIRHTLRREQVVRPDGTREVLSGPGSFADAAARSVIGSRAATGMAPTITGAAVQAPTADVVRTYAEVRVLFERAQDQPEGFVWDAAPGDGGGAWESYPGFPDGNPGHSRDAVRTTSTVLLAMTDSTLTDSPARLLGEDVTADDVPGAIRFTDAELLPLGTNPAADPADGTTWTATAGTTALVPDGGAPAVPWGDGDDLGLWAHEWASPTAGAYVAGAATPAAYHRHPGRPFTVTVWARTTAGTMRVAPEIREAGATITDPAQPFLVTTEWTRHAITLADTTTGTMTAPSLAFRLQEATDPGATLRFRLPQAYAGAHDRGDTEGMRALPVPRGGWVITGQPASGQAQQLNRVDVHGSDQFGHVTAAHLDVIQAGAVTATATDGGPGRRSLRVGVVAELHGDGTDHVAVTVEEVAPTGATDTPGVFVQLVDPMLEVDATDDVQRLTVSRAAEADPGDATSVVGNYAAADLSVDLDNTSRQWSPYRADYMAVGHEVETAVGVVYLNRHPDPRGLTGEGWDDGHVVPVVPDPDGFAPPAEGAVRGAGALSGVLDVGPGRYSVRLWVRGADDPTAVVGDTAVQLWTDPDGDGLVDVPEDTTPAPEQGLQDPDGDGLYTWPAGVEVQPLVPAPEVYHLVDEDGDGLYGFAAGVAPDAEGLIPVESVPSLTDPDGDHLYTPTWSGTIAPDTPPSVGVSRWQQVDRVVDVTGDLALTVSAGTWVEATAAEVVRLDPDTDDPVEVVEATPMGRFYVTAWPMATDSPTVTLSAVDVLGYLGGTFWTPELTQGVGIAEAITEVARGALDLGEDQVTVLDSGRVLPWRPPSRDSVGTQLANLAMADVLTLYTSPDGGLMARNREGVEDDLGAEYGAGNALVAASTPLALDDVLNRLEVTGHPLEADVHTTTLATVGSSSPPDDDGEPYEPGSEEVELTPGQVEHLVVTPEGDDVEAILVVDVGAVYAYHLSGGRTAGPNVGRALDDGQAVPSGVVGVSVANEGTQARVRLENRAGGTVTVSHVALAGRAVRRRSLTVERTRPWSRRRYGTRGTELDVPLGMDPSLLEAVADNVLDLHSLTDEDGRHVLPDLEVLVMGDPWREPGDRVLASEPDSGIGGEYRVVSHDLDVGVAMTSSLYLRRALTGYRFAVAGVDTADGPAVTGY